MLYLILMLPIALFLVLALLIRLRGRVWILLLVASPFVAASLTIAAGTTFTNIGSPPASLRDWLSYVLTAYLFILPEAIYPNTVLIGALVLLGWVFSESFTSVCSFAAARRLWMFTLMGFLFGGLFLAAVGFVYHTPLADLGNNSGFTNRDRIPPFTVPMSLITGALDGAIIALFGKEGNYRQNGKARRN